MIDWGNLQLEVTELGEQVFGSSLNTLLEGSLLFFVELGCQKLDVFLNIGNESLLVISWLLLYIKKKRAFGSVLVMLPIIKRSTSMFLLTDSESQCETNQPEV